MDIHIKYLIGVKILRVFGQECMDARFTFDNGETSYHCIEWIYWIRKTKRMISFLEPMSELHLNKVGFEQALFGGLCRGRLLIGHEKGVTECRIDDNFTFPVYTQNLINKEKEQIRQYCVTNDVVVICGGDSCNNVQNRRVELLKFITSIDQQLTKVPCSTLLPLNIGQGSVLGNLGDNTVILLGGSCKKDECHLYYDCCPVDWNNEHCAVTCPSCPGTIIFEGKINYAKDDVIWKQLKPLSSFRLSPIVFKMKDYVYVAGGKSLEGYKIDSCERYNLKTRNWEDCEHSLPSSLTVEYASVAVSRDETEAIIFGSQSHFTNYNLWTNCCYGVFTPELPCSSLVIIFCEINGFSIADEKKFSSKIECSTKRHVSIRH